MSRDILTIDTSFASAFQLEDLELHDLEAIRLILDGTSVIDWHKLDLDTLDKVDAFLRVSCVDPQDEDDMERLRFVLNQAVNYLEEHQGIRLPEDLRNPEDVREVFVAASTWSGRFRRHQAMACMILKLMHTINHMEAADLKHRLPISEAELIDRVERSIISHANEMRREGYPLQAFYSSRKTRTSVISKLLSKRESIAATLYDKIRFRIVVDTPEELLSLLAYLSRKLFPMNYVIPDESHNNLLDLRLALQRTPRLAELSKKLQRLSNDEGGDEQAQLNPFSARSYRVINFIVDYPIRVDDILAHEGIKATYLLGRIVYVMVEFQLVDRETAKTNEEGANAHELYKERQKKVVEERLLRGSLKKSSPS